MGTFENKIKPGQKNPRIPRLLAERQTGRRDWTGHFAKGDFVDAIGVTKGRGFEGVVKRHHFRGGDITHGATKGGTVVRALLDSGSSRERLCGDENAPAIWGRRRTVQNLQVVRS